MNFRSDQFQEIQLCRSINRSGKILLNRKPSKISIEIRLASICLVSCFARTVLVSLSSRIQFWIPKLDHFHSVNLVNLANFRHFVCQQTSNVFGLFFFGNFQTHVEQTSIWHCQSVLPTVNTVQCSNCLGYNKQFAKRCRLISQTLLGGFRSGEQSELLGSI